MTNRRRFLQSAAAISAAPLAARANTNRSATGEIPVNTDRTLLVYDTRFVQARRFAEHGANAGVGVRAIEADISKLWTGELRALWSVQNRNDKHVVVGLTERPALFLLEQLGWEHDMRVVYQGQHDLKGNGSHEVVRSGDAALGRILVDAAADWPAALAESLLKGQFTNQKDFYPSESGMAEHNQVDTRLYSWVIAPRTVRHS